MPTSVPPFPSRHWRALLLAVAVAVIIVLPFLLQRIAERREIEAASRVAHTLRVEGALSALLAPPSLVMASAAAFLLSELADLAVYTPLARRRLVAAVVASGMVGLVVDSIVFLGLAFGSLDFLAGQVVGKAWMVLLSVPFVIWLRRRDARLGLLPA